MTQTQAISRPAARTHPWWLPVGFWMCAAISIAVAMRRILALIEPEKAGTTALAEINATFSSHAALTAAHIVPAAVFVLLAAIVLFRSTRAKWLTGAFFVAGVVTGVTAYAMSAYAIGGWIERSAVLVFDTWFLFSLACAFRFYLRGERAREREWTSRAVAVLLGIATTRPVMGLFFATSGLTHLSPREFFGIAFWIGFSVNALVIEFWLHSKRRANGNRFRCGRKRNQIRIAWVGVAVQRYRPGAITIKGGGAKGHPRDWGSGQLEPEGWRIQLRTEFRR